MNQHLQSFISPAVPVPEMITWKGVSSLMSGGQVRFGIRGFCLDSCLYDGCWPLALVSVGVLWVVGGLSPLRCWHRYPGVNTGVDHYDLQTLNIYIFPSILVLTLGSG